MRCSLGKRFFFLAILLSALSLFSTYSVAEGPPQTTATISGRIFYLHNGSAAALANLTVLTAPRGLQFPQLVINSTLTDSDGNYSIFINASDPYGILFPFTPITLSAKIITPQGNVTFVTPTLPPIPPANKSNMSLYLSPVVILKVSPTYNGIPVGTGPYVNCSFSGVAMDQQVAVPYEFFENKTVSYNLILPQDRNYSILIMTPQPVQTCRMGSPPKQVNNTGGTSGLFTNTSAANSTNLAVPTVRSVSPELNFTTKVVTGFFKINGISVPPAGITFENPLFYIEVNKDPKNYTLVPSNAKFPFKAFNQNDSINNETGEFSFTLASGTSYIIGGFANNVTNVNESWGGYQNLTNLQSNLTMNITIYPLTGKRYTGSAKTNVTENASDITLNQITFNVTTETNDVTGKSVMGAPMNLYLTYPNGLKVQWVLEGGQQNGERPFQIPANTNVTLSVFNMRFAPIQLVIPYSRVLSYVQSNNSVIPVQMKKFDVRRPRMMPGNMSENTNFTSTNPVIMQFMKSNSTCSVPNAPPECIIKQVDDAKSFDPMTFMMLGTIDILMTQDIGGGRNIKVKYIGASLMSSAPPDAQYMDTPIDQSADGKRETWRFGSSAPKIYEYALVAIPYNSSRINENALMHARIPLLYDQNGNVIYNRTDPAKNATPDDYQDYDPRWFNGSDVICDVVYNNSLCYQDKATDTLWLRMEHFSEVGPESEGSIPGAPAINLTDSTAAFNNTWTNSPPFRFNFTAVDNDSLTMNCTLFINNVFNSTNTSVLNNTPTSLTLNGTYSDASYSWRINCTDQYGYSGLTYNRTFTVDYTPPTAAIQYPTNTVYSTPPVSLNFTAGDANGISSCKYELTNSSGAYNISIPGCQNTTIAGATEGSNSIKVWANDSANNWNSSAATIFTVDLSPPSITSANTTPSRAYNGTNVTISVVATDSKTSVVSVVANITRPSGTTYLLPLSYSGSVWSNTTLVDEVGTYTAVLNATDAVGWTYARTLTFLSAVNTTITYNITNSTGGTPSITIAIIAPENDGTLNFSSSGNNTLSTPAGTVTIRIVDTNTKVSIDLPVNLTGTVSFSPVIQQENATALVSAPTYNTPLLVQTIAPNITIYANATLKFNYSGLGVTAGEAYRLRVNKCTTYNASANACNGTWAELASSVDNATQTVTANVSSFSTFMLANKTSVCGNTIPETGEDCDAGSSGSSSCTSSCTTITSTPPPSGGGSTGPSYTVAKNKTAGPVKLTFIKTATAKIKLIQTPGVTIYKYFSLVDKFKETIHVNLKKFKAKVLIVYGASAPCVECDLNASNVLKQQLSLNYTVLVKNDTEVDSCADDYFVIFVGGPVANKGVAQYAGTNVSYQSVTSSQNGALYNITGNCYVAAGNDRDYTKEAAKTFVELLK